MLSHSSFKIITAVSDKNGAFAFTDLREMLDPENYLTLVLTVDIRLPINTA